jgi:hypothetical protein
MSTIQNALEQAMGHGDLMADEQHKWKSDLWILHAHCSDYASCPYKEVPVFVYLLAV